MKYIHVENNTLIGVPQDLPTSWENISNFHALDDTSLLEFGWYPFEQIIPELAENEIIVDWNITIEPTKVIRTPVTRLLTQAEIDTRNDILLEKQWQEIRTSRNILLSDCDWIMLSDAPVENKTDWGAYRQNLRDITLAPSPNQVVWPPKPNIIKLTPVVPVEPPTDLTALDPLPE